MHGDWILTYPDTQYRFGPPEHPVQLVGWEIATDSYRVDDTAIPRADGTWFGQDQVEAGEIKIIVKIDFTTAPYPAEECARRAWAIRSELARVWRADVVRQTPGLLAQLTMGDEMREGRPRRAKFDDDHQGVGLIFAELSFIPASTTAYAVDENGEAPWREQTVGLVPAQIGGLLAPLRAPLTTAAASSRARPFVVGGAAPAWPTITVKGPLQAGASVELTGRWSLPLARSLAFNEVAEIVTEPGRVSMTLNGRPAVVLAPSADIDVAFMNPGPQEIALRGRSVEGTASLTIRWRETRED